MCPMQQRGITPEGQRLHCLRVDWEGLQSVAGYDAQHSEMLTREVESRIVAERIANRY